MSRPSLIAAVCAVALAGCAGAGGGRSALAQPLALLDAHTHLMTEILSNDEEIALLRRAGLDRVLLMHPEPEVLAALARKYPGFVIPSVNLARPAAKGVHLDKDTGALFARLAAEKAVCSFGEISGGNIADVANMSGVYAAAAASGVPINLHTDLASPANLAAVEAALTTYPKMNFVLAHLGWTAGPELMGRLLDAHPNLYTDVSIRFDAPGSLAWRNNGLDLSILAPDETIPPAWRAVMERHPDRFLFAMDINSFGPRYTITEDLIRTARKALAPLPRPLAEAIAHGNAERLLKGCGA